ncbi:protein RFT1 homolog isoform X2 [Daphnia carinata]|uniref:protein RFT1 homolog isoform X2 n=1 Tax=Daphnia carinata TaxID=120202 RepID=UPI0028695E8F|nr:protein RFT1 homolog isoform X2 [Daphnia carinata]
MDGDKILEGSIKAASYNMILQVAFRIITFILNGLVLHNVDKDVLGILNVRLMLLIMTILFISREAFRRGCMSKTREHNWPQVINLLWLTVPSVIICSFSFCYIWLHWLELPAEKYVADYKFAVYIFGISCVIESFVEPVYLFSQAFQYVRWRIFVDCVMMLIRVGTLVVSVLYYPAYTIKATACGQVAVSTVLVVLYWFYFYQQFQRKANLIKNKDLHKDDPLLALPLNSVLDFFPKRIQGQVCVYDVVNNLGSMAARFIFLPIEESSYFYFAQMLNRQIPIEQQPRQEIEQVARVLYRLLRALSLIGSIIVVFGFSYSHLLLRLYGGITLTDGPGPLLMKTHCLSVCLMAINGVTEAYVFAAMSSKELDKYNGLMVILSCVFLFLSWLLSRAVGSVGFILANCVNMLLRIIHSLWFISGQYQNLGFKPLRGMIPTMLETSSLVFAFAITATSSLLVYPESAIFHVIIGAICGLAVIGAVLYEEPELMRTVVIAVKKRLGKVD